MTKTGCVPIAVTLFEMDDVRAGRQSHVLIISMGKFVEQFQRTQKFDAILGGAEEVLGDLGVRQAMRKIPEGVRL